MFEAFCWLEEHLSSEPKVEVDWDKLVDDAPPVAPEGEESPKEESPKEQARRADDPNDLVGKEWEDGDPIPAPLPMLIPYFIPMEPYLGYLWGQSQTYKTFLLNTMAVAVASGTRFAGYQVTTRGLVYQVELEGSRSQVRIQAAKQFAGISGKLPIVHVTQTPPSLIGAGKRVTHEWKKWARQLVQKAKAAAARHGVPLGSSQLTRKTTLQALRMSNPAPKATSSVMLLLPWQRRLIARFWSRTISARTRPRVVAARRSSIKVRGSSWTRERAPRSSARNGF